METGSISTESPARQSLSENTESLQPGSAIFPFLGDFAGRFDPHCVKVVAVLSGLRPAVSWTTVAL
jgi:hypothetical protein